MPEGHTPIDSATDKEIDERVAAFAWSISHPMVTCKMGEVVDSECRVKGLKGLRVVDASVLPVTPAGTIQAVIYAVAERVAGMIAEGVR